MTLKCISSTERNGHRIPPTIWSQHMAMSELVLNIKPDMWQRRKFHTWNMPLPWEVSHHSHEYRSPATVVRCQCESRQYFTDKYLELHQSPNMCRAYFTQSHQWLVDFGHESNAKGSCQSCRATEWNPVYTRRHLFDSISVSNENTSCRFYLIILSEHHLVLTNKLIDRLTEYTDISQGILLYIHCELRKLIIIAELRDIRSFYFMDLRKLYSLAEGRPGVFQITFRFPLKDVPAITSVNR